MKQSLHIILICCVFNSDNIQPSIYYEKARKDLDIPDNFDVMAMISIGKIGTKENLPQHLQEREHPNEYIENL